MAISRKIVVLFHDGKFDAWWFLLTDWLIMRATLENPTASSNSSHSFSFFSVSLSIPAFFEVILVTFRTLYRWNKINIIIFYSIYTSGQPKLCKKQITDNGSFYLHNYKTFWMKLLYRYAFYFKFKHLDVSNNWQCSWSVWSKISLKC